MPLSNDPERRGRQLANLTPGAGAAAAQPGNERAATHGAYARLPADRVDAKVREVAAALAEDAPVRAADGGLPAHDTVAVRQLAEALCRLDNIADYLVRRGWEDDSGKPRPVLEYEGRLRSHVLDLLRELGMTPASRAKLGLDIARSASHMDLAAAWAEDGDVIDGSAADDR